MIYLRFLNRYVIDFWPNYINVFVLKQAVLMFDGLLCEIMYLQ